MTSSTSANDSLADMPQLTGVTHVNGTTIDDSDNGARYFTGTRQVVARRHRPGAFIDQGVAEEALAR